jgi:FkbM family methyltransferase
MFYSQCGEDKLIYEKYISKLNLENPIYLEMGAMEGIKYSNTYFFEQKLNWTGILIEPSTYNFIKLEKNRPNNKLFNNLISNITDKELDYINYECECLSGVAGVIDTIPKDNMLTYYENDNDWQKQMRDKYLHIRKIKPITLSKVIEDSKFDKIDFFSLDVEGHEYEVLCSYDWSIPINMFLIENNPNKNKIDQLLLSKNYIFIEFIGPNSFWILDCFKKQHNL